MLWMFRFSKFMMAWALCCMIASVKQNDSIFFVINYAFFAVYLYFYYDFKEDALADKAVKAVRNFVLYSMHQGKKKWNRPFDGKEAEVSIVLHDLL